MNFFDTQTIGQKAYSLDKVTLTKVGKGALIAGAGSMALFLLDFLGTVEFANPQVAVIVSFSVPFGINLIKEYIKGK